MSYPTRKQVRPRTGRCQDCGWTKQVRTIAFWLNGMRYVVCAECERPYKDRAWPVAA